MSIQITTFTIRVLCEIFNSNVMMTLELNISRNTFSESSV